jgi:hypothetical protein
VQQAVLFAGAPRAELWFQLAEAGAVEVRLRAVDGSLVQLPVTQTLQLYRDGRDTGLLAGRERGRFGARTFQRVPGGTYELRLTDERRDADRVSWPRYESFVPRRVEVRPGATTPVDVDGLQPRAQVRLRIADAGGRTPPGSSLRVRAGGLTVHAGAAAWQGWLPPGDYELQVEVAGASRRERLQVGRADIVLDLRP